MAAEPNVDKSGEITWFALYGPGRVVGPCPHADCKHQSMSVIAWGPDMRRYTLERCDDVCEGECRAWHSERPFQATSPWLQVTGGDRRGWR